MSALTSGNPAVRAAAQQEAAEEAALRPVFSLNTLDAEGAPLGDSKPPIPFGLNGRTILLRHPDDMPLAALESATTDPIGLARGLVIDDDDWDFFEDNVLTAGQLNEFIEAFYEVTGMGSRGKRRASRR